MNAWTTVIGFILGGSFLTFLQFLINRHDNKQDKNDAVLSALKDVSERVERIEDSLDKRDAVLARTHILRFDDELCNGVKHSKEYFQQQLQDIDTYTHFCRQNPDFENSYAVEAIKHIKEVYRICRDEDKFI